MRRVTFILGAAVLALSFAAVGLWIRLQSAQLALATIEQSSGVCAESATALEPSKRRPDEDLAPESTAASDEEHGGASGQASNSALQRQAIRELRRAAHAERRKALQSAEFRALALGDKKRLVLDNTYDLESWIPLSQAMRDRLITLLAEQMLESELALPESRTEFDAFQAGTEPPDWARRQKELEASHREELEGLLGYEKMQQWEDYQARGYGRGRARELDGRLGEIGDGLRTQQTRSLAEVFEITEGLANTNAMNQTAVGSSLEEQLEVARRKNDQIRSAAASILTPAQLTMLEEMLDEEVHDIRSSMLQRRAAAR